MGEVTRIILEGVNEMLADKSNPGVLYCDKNDVQLAQLEQLKRSADAQERIADALEASVEMQQKAMAQVEKNQAEADSIVKDMRGVFHLKQPV